MHLLLYMLLQFLDLLCILHVSRVRLFNNHGWRVQIFAAEPVGKLRVAREILEKLLLNYTRWKRSDKQSPSHKSTVSTYLLSAHFDRPNLSLLRASPLLHESHTKSTVAASFAVPEFRHRRCVCRNPLYQLLDEVTLYGKRVKKSAFSHL